MDTKHVKQIGILVFILVVISLFFVLGVSVGVSFEQENLVNVLIPSISALGSWVAGIGALAAVLTSLWLAEQQRKADSENLKIFFSVYIFSSDSESRLAVSVTSIGNKPSHVNSISILSRDTEVALMIANLDDKYGYHLPTLLSYGVRGMFVIHPNSEDAINNYVKKRCGGRYENLRISVNTTVSSFELPFSKEVINHLKNSDAKESASEGWRG